MLDGKYKLAFIYYKQYLKIQLDCCNNKVYKQLKLSDRKNNSLMATE